MYVYLYIYTALLSQGRNCQICEHPVIEIDLDVYPLVFQMRIWKTKKKKARSQKDFGALALCVYKETRHIYRIIIFFCMYATISFICVHLLSVYVSKHLFLVHSMTNFGRLSTNLCGFDVWKSSEGSGQSFSTSIIRGWCGMPRWSRRWLRNSSSVIQWPMVGCHQMVDSYVSPHWNPQVEDVYNCIFELCLE